MRAVRAWLPWRRSQKYEWEGINVHELLVPFSPIASPRNSTEPNIPVAEWARDIALRIVARELERHLQPVELAHSVGLGDHALATQIVAERRNLPHVVQLIGSDVNNLTPAMARSAAFRRAMAGVSLFVANSEALACQFKQKAEPRAAVRVAHRGVNTEEFSYLPLSNAQKPCVFLYLGGMISDRWSKATVDAKGADVILQAWQRLDQAEDQTVELVIAGPHISQVGICQFMSSLRNPSRVTLKGSVRHTEVAAMIRSADVVVIPSRSEGLPNVCLEAMAVGRPVIGSAIEGIQEAMGSDETGWFARPGDEEHLAEVIKTAAASRIILLQKGAAARKRIERHFDSSAYGETLALLYDEVTSSRRCAHIRSCIDSSSLSS